MHVQALSPTRLVHAALIAAWVCAALVSARVCVAASCPVEVRGAASEPWLRAARVVETLTTEFSDCARIEIDVEHITPGEHTTDSEHTTPGELSTGGARLIFVTLDGRRAERHLAHPNQLLPTAVALGVGGASQVSMTAPDDRPLAPAPLNPGPSQPIEPQPVQSRPDQSQPDGPPPAQPPAAPDDARAIFAVLAGARGGAGRLVSPVLGGVAAIAPGRWDLGLNLALELQYFDLQLPEPDGPSSAASLGVTVGRREPLADVELLYGVRSMVAALNDESEKDSGVRGGAEIRVGAYVGGVWPRHWSSRFRGELVLDVVPHNSLGAIGRPVTPWLALTVSIGVEFDGA